MEGKDIPYLKALVISMLRTLLSTLPLHSSLAHPAYGLGQRVQEAQVSICAAPSYAQCEASVQL